jgi:hypothetical protein
MPGICLISPLICWCRTHMASRSSTTATGSGGMPANQVREVVAEIITAHERQTDRSKLESSLKEQAPATLVGLLMDALPLAATTAVDASVFKKIINDFFADQGSKAIRFKGIILFSLSLSLSLLFSLSLSLSLSLSCILSFTYAYGIDGVASFDRVTIEFRSSLVASREMIERERHRAIDTLTQLWEPMDIPLSDQQYHPLHHPWIAIDKFGCWVVRALGYFDQFLLMLPLNELKDHNVTTIRFEKPVHITLVLSAAEPLPLHKPKVYVLLPSPYYNSFPHWLST